MREDLRGFIANPALSIKAATKALGGHFRGNGWLACLSGVVFLLAPVASQAQTSQTVTWVGGNTLGRYSEPSNWNIGAPPVNNPGTNYVVVVGPNDSVLYDWPGPVTLSSLNLGSASRFQMAGDSVLNIENAALVGGLLEALNGNAVFHADAFGTTFGPQARVQVANGSRVTIAGTAGSQYEWTVDRGPASVFSVRGENSLLDLSELAVLSMNNRYFDSPKIIEALDGGRLVFADLTSVTGARSDSQRLQFRAANRGIIELPQLRTVQGRTWFRMELPEYAFPSLQTAQDTLFDLDTNRVLRFPVLNSLSGPSAGFLVGVGSRVEATNLLSFSDGIVDLARGGTIEAPKLVTFQNAGLDLTPEKNLVAPPFRNIDNARFSVTEGASWLVASASYDWTHDRGAAALFTADGTNSILDFRTIQSLRMNRRYFDEPKAILSKNAGRIDASGVLQVIGARTDGHPLLFQVETGGEIDLSGLRETAGYTKFLFGWGRHTLPSLLAATNTAFELGSGAQLNLPTLTVMAGSNSRITVPFVATLQAPSLQAVFDTVVDLSVSGNLDVPNLQTFANSTISLSPGKNLLTTPWTNINNSTLIVSGNNNLAIDAPAYEWTYDRGRTTVFSAEGAGSNLDLSSLRHLNFNNRYFDSAKLVVAKVNGRIDLSSLEEIVGARSDGQPVTLQAESGGSIMIGSPLVSRRCQIQAAGDTSLLQARSLTLAPSVRLGLTLNATLELSRALVFSNTVTSEVNLDAGRVRFVGGGPKQLEVGGLDGGRGGTATANFGCARLIVGADGQKAALQLVDSVNNGNWVGDNREALYLLGDPFGRSLDLVAGSVLVLNGLNAYALVNGQMIWLNDLIPPGTNSVAFDQGYIANLGGPAITNMTPAGTITPSVNAVEATFDLPIQPSSFTVADVDLTGPAGNVPVTSVSLVNGNTWRISFAPQSADGAYTVRVGPNIDELGSTLNGMDQNGNGLSGETEEDVFTGTFVIDGSAPQIVGAYALQNGTRVGVTFNEAVDPEFATNAANYSVNGLMPDDAVLTADGTRVALSVAPLVGDSFAVEITGSRDQLGNQTDRTATGVILPLESQDIGVPGSNPALSGSTLSFQADDFEMGAGGSDYYWYSSDAGHFAFQECEGDFDIRVRIVDMTTAETYTQAGLMWRESTAANARRIYICVNHPNRYDNCWALIRWTTGGSGEDWPSYSRPRVGVFPNVWLRLKREGDLFTAFRGSDGEDWQPYATVTAGFPRRGIAGPATSARNNAATVTAWYQGFADIVPVVSTHPQSQSVASGAGVTFGVTARGLPTLNYQWQFNGSLLPGQTGGLLVLPSVTTAQAGDYSVVVSNDYGSVTSQAATLVVDGVGLGGFEADVAPLPGGNNAVTVSDWVRVGRLVAALESPINSSEFARADGAPRTNAVLGTLPLGDGRLTVADWTQAGRYAAGVDPLTPVGGPTSPIAPGSAGHGSRGSAIARSSTDQRQLAMAEVKIGTGQPFAVPVILTALGGENALGFSVQFDPTRLTYRAVALGEGAAGAMLQANANEAGQGRLGVVLARPTGESFAPGETTVVVLDLVAGEVAGHAALAFTDVPVWREIADVEAGVLASSYTDAVVRIVAPAVWSTAVRVTGGEVELRLAGEPGERYRVERSEDLREWSLVTVVTAGPEPYAVRDPAAEGVGHTFYRAVLE